MCELTELRHNHLSLEKNISLLIWKQPAPFHTRAHFLSSTPGLWLQGQIYQGRTRLHLQNLSTNQPKRDPQQGYQPLFPVEPPKASFFVLLQGTVCQGNPLSPVQAEQGTSRARRDPRAPQSPWRKGIPPKVDPNLQPYLKIKLSSFVCARCAGATSTLNKKGAK